MLCNIMYGNPIYNRRHLTFELYLIEPNDKPSSITTGPCFVVIIIVSVFHSLEVVVVVLVVRMSSAEVGVDRGHTPGQWGVPGH